MSHTVGQCLREMTAGVIKDGDTLADAATAAAPKCVASFHKLVNTEDPSAELGAGFEADIAEKCDPTANPLLPFVESATYTVGPATLGAANLGAYCASLGGDATIDSFADWKMCLRAAADAEARQAIAVRWPQALDHFEALKVAIAALPATTRTADALSALTQLDAAIEGAVEDNIPDPSAGPAGLLETGEQPCYPDCSNTVPDDDTRVKHGVAASYSDNHDGTITDHVTGLTWEKLSDDGSIHDRDTTWPFAAAFTTKIAALNAGSGFAGHTDWRLPNRRELDSLVDIGRSTPMIRAPFDKDCAPGCTILGCSCTATGRYWSSTSLQSDASAHWFIDFSDGAITPSAPGGAESYGVRAVRGGVSVPALKPPATGESASPSLAECQKTVATRSAKYIGALAQGVGKCLGKISNKVIAKGATVADAAAAEANACASALRKIVNSDSPANQLGSRFTSDVAEDCDPSVNPALEHPEDATFTIGSHTLSSAKLAAYCLPLGGDAVIDSFAKWSDCIRRAAEAEAQQAIALRWPRALEYFAALQLAIGASPASSRQVDALAALALLDARIEGDTNDDQPDPPPAPPSGVLATGQTQCMQGDSSIGACPGGVAGQDGDVKAGLERHYTDNGDGTITDNATGLTWEKLGDDDSIHDYDFNYTFTGSALNKIARLNRHSFAGHNDWRVPNRREIESLIDAGHVAPAIDPIFHHDCTPGCSSLTCSCTASTDFITSNRLPWENGWRASFLDGSMRRFYNYVGRVRAVRGGSMQTPVYANQPPTALNRSIRGYKGQICVPLQPTGVDDSGWMYWEITQYPVHGFLTQFLSDPIPHGVDDNLIYWGPSDDSWNGWELLPQPSYDPDGSDVWKSNFCYITFDPSFVGFDSFQYRVLDSQGLASTPAVVSIEITEN